MFRLLLFSLVITFGASSYGSQCGVFRVVKGKVTFQKKNKKKFKKARINKKVCAGDRIRTASDSRAKVVMAGNNEINVNPDSELLIEKYTNEASGKKQVLLNVIYGKIRSNVKQKYKDDKQSFYRVKTKSAVAGVRGTEFVMGYDIATQTSKVVTFEGQVAVGSFNGAAYQATVTVGPGQFTTNSAQKAPHAPAKMPSKELVQIDQETTLPDSGVTDRGVSNDPSTAAPASGKDQGEAAPDEKPPAGILLDGADGDSAESTNRTPSSTTGVSNDFDDLVDSELADVELDPAAVGIGIDPADFPTAPPVIDPTNVGGLPNYEPPQQTTDQLLNQRVKLTIGVCIEGTPGCP